MAIMIHYDPALRRYCFQKISSTEIEVELRQRAEDVVAFVSKDLDIAPPEVIWIRPSSPTSATSALGTDPLQWKDHIHPEYARVLRDILGGYSPQWQGLRQIWIRRELDFRGLVFTVAHETRHIWQKDKDRALFEDECRAEFDAYAYAFDVTKRYLAMNDCLTLEVEAEIDRNREAARSELERQWPGGRFEAIDHCEE
jgi:hypothetical protein